MSQHSSHPATFTKNLHQYDKETASKEMTRPNLTLIIGGLHASKREKDPQLDSIKFCLSQNHRVWSDLKTRQIFVLPITRHGANNYPR